MRPSQTLRRPADHAAPLPFVTDAAPSGATTVAALAPLFDRVHDRLRAGQLEGLEHFVAALNAIRSGLPAAEWRQAIADVVRDHPALPLLHEEPFTGRAFAKPRGYAGDAPMLDLVYGDVGAERPRTALGRRLHEWAVNQPACRSVRERRDILAALIDRTAAAVAAPRIMSVACGHLREAQRSEAVRAGAVAEFVAFDQDPASLAVVEREQAHLNVQAVRGSVRRLLVTPVPERYDLVYSAGLYDYLPQPVAEALTAAMFGMLRPGGTLLVANFAPDLRDIGYMEAVMDWHLIYRDERELRALAARIPAEAVAEASVSRDPAGNVVYLQLRRA